MSKKVSIVFHSVCGNNFLMAKEFYNEFSKYDIEVQLLRINDPNHAELAKQFTVGGQYKNDIFSIEEASVDLLLESDLIVMGCPTYFGNVSGAMKTFMDKFSPYWAEATFFGKKFFAFSSCSNGEGGGDMCLNEINKFAQHMGMTPIPVPANLLSSNNFPAFGLIHYSGDYANMRPSRHVLLAIKEMTERLMSI